MATTEQAFPWNTNITNTSANFPGNSSESVNTTELFVNISKSDLFNETLDELNFRFAQTLLPFAVLLGLFCFVGVVGNSIVILVFLLSKGYRNTNFKVFVLSLAAVDLISWFTLIPAEIFKTRHFFSISDHTPCKVKCFLNIFAMSASAYILLVICVDRYRKVCQPLKRQILPSLAAKLLIGVFLLSLVLSLPAAIMCGVTEHLKTNAYNESITVFVCSAEKKYHRSTIRYIYKVGLSALLLVIAVALIVMYVLVMKTVVKHWGKREPGECVRFETNRSRPPSGDKLQAIDNENVIIHLKVVEVEAHINALLKVSLNGPNTDCGFGDKAKSGRSSSRTSLNSYLTKGKFSVHRSSSDASFRTRTSQRSSSFAAAGRLPYKTLIWFILTLVFLITFIINAGLSFMTTKEHELSPRDLFWFQVFFRIYFINNIINPVIYAWLDKRFNKSRKEVMTVLKRKFCRR